MKTRLKKYLNKHKNRIFSLIAVFACIPCFLCLDAYAYSSEYHFYPMSRDYVYWAANNDISVIQNETYPCEKLSSNIYKKSWSNDSGTYRYSSIIFGNSNANFYYPFDTSKYDYYALGVFTCDFENPSSVNTDFNLVDIDVITFDSSSFDTINIVPDINFVTNENSLIYNFIFPFDNYYDFSALRFNFDKNIVITNRNNVSFSYQLSVLAVDKGASENDIQSIITAINNQTSSLGGKIDDTNDYINFGNGSTGGIVSDNNSAIDNLDEVVSEYHATEQQFFDDFTANQQAINSDIVGWSWGGLVNCANWVGETMTDYYNNMGDFRQYIIYPLMLGIVLFFLGRGGAIIGHLFRKPTQSTVNIESTSFKRGNTRYTTTTTSKKGGVFRK